MGKKKGNEILKKINSKKKIKNLNVNNKISSGRTQ